MNSELSDDLEPPARFILHTIHHKGPITRSELMDETGYSESTIDRSLESLRESGAVNRERDMTDARKFLYSASERPSD